MLVVIMEDQLVAPGAVCQSCLLANQQGQPRWRQGQLLCGRALANNNANQPLQYECQMGFRITNIE